MNFTTIINEIIVLIIYIVIGYFLRKKDIISTQGAKDISKIVVKIALPLLVFKSFLIPYEQEYVKNMIYIGLAAFTILSISIIISGFILKKVSGDKLHKATMRYCMVFGNIAFLGYPICSALYGDIGIFYASIYVAVQNLFIWTIGVSFFINYKLNIKNVKRIFSPALIGIIIGIIEFFLQIPIPDIIQKVISGIGSITVPLALMLIGASLYGHSIIEVFSNRKVLLLSLIKIFIFPVVFFSILYFIPIDPMIKTVLVVQMAAPVQASSTAFAHNYNGDEVIAAKSVVVSTILCVITIPVYLFILQLI